MLVVIPIGIPTPFFASGPIQFVIPTTVPTCSYVGKKWKICFFFRVATRQMPPLPICHTELNEPRQRTGIATRFLR